MDRIPCALSWHRILEEWFAFEEVTNTSFHRASVHRKGICPY
jgi:hypothetical protein